MPVAYRYKEGDKPIFEKEVNPQLDPLESINAGKEIWLLPANCTWKEPLAEKEGFEIWYNKDEDDWYYKEVEKEPEPEPYVPTEKDKLNDRLWQLKVELQNSDYKAIKFAEGWISEEDYAPIKAERQAIRDEINEIEAQIAELDDETNEEVEE